MSRRLVAALATLALGITATVVSVAMAEPAQAGSCTMRTGSAKTDPDGHSWTTWWVCGNAPGAGLYRTPAATTLTGYMDTTSSWFVCWKRGAQHAGGNNVWYYSQGDRAASGQSARHAWGFMPAVNVYTSVDPWTGMAECPSSTVPSTPTPTTTTTTTPAKPGRNDNPKPLVLLHGYDSDHTLNCNEYWGGNSGSPIVADYLRGTRWFSSVEYVTFYNNTSNCMTMLPQYGPRNNVTGTEDEPIDDIAANFAWWVYYKYSRYNVSIDVITHSMGGLITRAAITGTNKRLTTSSGKTFPDFLYIEDVATLSTPHDGAKEGVCIFGLDNLQCEQMDMDDDFMRKFSSPDNPQSGVGTDWSAIGSTGDWVVGDDSATDLKASTHFAHKYLYLASGVGHKNITNLLSGTYSVDFCDRTVSCDPARQGTWWHTYAASPVHLAGAAAHYSSTY